MSILWSRATLIPPFKIKTKTKQTTKQNKKEKKRKEKKKQNKTKQKNKNKKPSYFLGKCLCLKYFLKIHVGEIIKDNY